jgi:hypothetical protein
MEKGETYAKVITPSFCYAIAHGLRKKYQPSTEMKTHFRQTDDGAEYTFECDGRKGRVDITSAPNSMTIKISDEGVI